MKTLHRDNGAAHIKIERLKVKLKNAIDNKGVSLDREVTDDLHQVMEEEEEKAMSDVQPGSFRHIREIKISVRFAILLKHWFSKMSLVQKIHTLVLQAGHCRKQV